MHQKCLLSRSLFTSLLITCFSPLALAGKYSSGGGRSYSSSSSRSSNSGSNRPSSSFSSSSNRPSPTPSPSSRPSSPPSNFSSSRSSYSSGTSPSSSSSSRPTPPPGNSGFDSAAAREKKIQQSSQQFAQSRPVPPPVNQTRSTTAEPSPQPRTSYTSRSAGGVSNFGSSNRINRVANHYPAFSSYYSRPVIIYQDSYSSPFWYWMLDQPRPIRAAWYYNHQQDMDPSRQAALVAADPALPQAVAEVAATTPTPDPKYTPPGIEHQAMTAPVEVESTSEDSTTDTSLPVLPASNAFQNTYPVRNSSSPWPGMIIFIGGLGLVIWLVFFKRWKPAQA